MKYAFALSALVASTYAGAIPGEAHKHIQRRAADPQPICSFENHTFNDFNAWDATTPATSKRDLSATTWSPPSNLVKPLQEVWDHQMETYGRLGMDFKNFGYDQVMATKGKINYCVRWEGNRKVTAAQRTQIQDAIRKQFTKFAAVLKGFEGWPYDTVDVNIVGWAVNDRSILEGDVSNIDV